MSHSDAAELGREIAALRRRIDDLEAGQRARQLPHSSLDDGAMRMRDRDGVVRGVVGKQTDGTYALIYDNGPKPPTPTAPTLIAVEHGLVVYWDGTFEGSAGRPSDVARVDIHESETAGFAVDGSTIRSSLPAEGARLLVLDNQPHHVKLVAVTTSDVASDPSAEVSKTPLLISDLDVDALTGKTITGAIVRTAASGVRIALDSSRNQIVFYDDAGAVMGYIQPDVTFGGYDAIGGDPSGEHSYLQMFPLGPYLASVGPGGGSAQNYIDMQSNDYVELGPALAIGEPGFNGRVINAVDFGFENNLTPDASASVTISHNLGVIPVFAFATTNDGSGLQYLRYQAGAATATDLVFKVRDIRDGSETPGNNVDVYWLAIA